MKKVLLLNDTRSDEHHGCSRVMSNLECLLDRAGCEIIGRVATGKDWSKNQVAVNALHQCDMVLVNGEGTIHHNAKSGIQLLTAAREAKSHGKRACLINCTYQGNDANARELLRYFDFVSTRETFSKNELSRIGIKSEVIPDLSFYNWPSVLTQTKKGLVFTDCVLHKTSYKILQQMTPDFRFLPIHLSSADNYKKSPVTERMARFRFNKLVDDYYKARFVSKLKKFTTFSALDEHEFLAQISNASMLVSGRFHAVCFALMTSTPFYAVASNTFKLESLLHDIGLEKRLITAEHIDPTRFDDFSLDELDAIAKYKNFASAQFAYLESRLRRLS